MSHEAFSNRNLNIPNVNPVLGFDGKETQEITISPEAQKTDTLVIRDLGHIAGQGWNIDPQQHDQQIDDFFNNRQKPVEIAPPTPFAHNNHQPTSQAHYEHPFATPAPTGITNPKAAADRHRDAMKRAHF